MNALILSALLGTVAPCSEWPHTAIDRVLMESKPLATLQEEKQHPEEGTLDIQSYVKGYLAALETLGAEIQSKDYEKALATANKLIDLFYQQPKAQQGWNPYHKIEGLYNRARCYAGLGRVGDALNDLEAAFGLGYENWGQISEDREMDPLRGEERFKTLYQKVQEKGDKILILKNCGPYVREFTVGEIEYQSASSPELKALRRDWKLDEVAGKKDEATKIINLMVWVHNRVKHDGGNVGESKRDARSLVEYCDKSKRGVNCRMLSTILNEVYLAMGFKSRHVTCMPKSSTDVDCHVINAVWSKTLKKWVYMDPTNEGYFFGEDGNLLSVHEVRQNIRSGKAMKVNPNLNWNGEKRTESGYIQYMAKNLYWLITPMVSKVGFESEGKDFRYMTLLPRGFSPCFINSGIVTSNSEAFWAPPK